MAAVIVDTSEWVQYYRLADSAEAAEVRRLLANGDIAMVGVVYAELIAGARNQRQLLTLEYQLGALPFLEVTKETWNITGTILRELRRQGASIPLPDAAIAALALHHGCAVLTRDGHFERVPGLELHHFER